MVRSAWSACIALAICPLLASAEEPRAPDPAGANALSSELPFIGKRLLLSWPIEPKRISFEPGQAILGGDGTLQPYRLEITWWQSGPLELKTFQHVEPSAQLDCT